MKTIQPGRQDLLVVCCWHNFQQGQWAQVEWWLEHRHGWLVKPQWAGSLLGRMTRDEYQVLGSTCILARLDTLVFWEPFSWLTSVGTTRNTVIRLGWSRIVLAVLILHAAGVGLIGRPAIISGRCNKCNSLQLQNHYAHFPPLQHTHTFMQNTTVWNQSWEMIMGCEALYADRGRRNPVWSGKEAHWSLRGWIVKSAEHCGADYRPLNTDRYMAPNPSLYDLSKLIWYGFLSSMKKREWSLEISNRHEHNFCIVSGTPGCHINNPRCPCYITVTS